MPAIDILDSERLKFDFASLSFLLASVRLQRILVDLYLAEERFQTTGRLINKRSEYHVETVQPLLEEFGLQAGTNFLTEQQTIQLDNKLGPRLVGSLCGYTNDAIKFIDETVPFLKEASDKLHAALTELYPEKKFINFGPLDNKSDAN